MDWVFVVAAVVSAWAVLSVLGNERQRTDDAAAAAVVPLPAEPAPPAHG